MIQRNAKFVERYPLTSIGTWYVEPPIRLALTSTTGLAFRIARSKTATGSSLVFALIISNALCTMFKARFFYLILEFY